MEPHESPALWVVWSVDQKFVSATGQIQAGIDTPHEACGLAQVGPIVQGRVTVG